MQEQKYQGKEVAAVQMHEKNRMTRKGKER